MSQIEFETIIHKGTIEVPKEHADKVQGRVRVIIITDEKEHLDMVEYLMEHPLKAEEFTPLSREEIYDRTK